MHRQFDKFVYREFTELDQVQYPYMERFHLIDCYNIHFGIQNLINENISLNYQINNTKFIENTQEMGRL